MTVVYGIKTCDTMAKARKWLDENGVDYRFHDYRADGIDRQTLKRWIKAIGWEALLNKASTTFRQLPETDRTGIDEGKAVELMLGQPTLIKRPVLEDAQGVVTGFRPETYRARFG